MALFLLFFGKFRFMQHFCIPYDTWLLRVFWQALAINVFLFFRMFLASIEAKFSFSSSIAL